MAVLILRFAFEYFTAVDVCRLRSLSLVLRSAAPSGASPRFPMFLSLL